MREEMLVFCFVLFCLPHFQLSQWDDNGITESCRHSEVLKWQRLQKFMDMLSDVGGNTEICQKGSTSHSSLEM